MQRVVFTPTVADVLAANQLHWKAAFRRPRFWWVLSTGCALSAAMGAYFAWGPPLPALLASMVGWAAYLIALIALGCGTRYLLLYVSVPRTFNQQKALHGPMSISWSDECFEVTLKNGNIILDWSDFAQFAHNKRTIILYQTDSLFNFIPIRALSQAQITDLLRITDPSQRVSPVKPTQDKSP